MILWICGFQVTFTNNCKQRDDLESLQAIHIYLNSLIVK